MTLTLEQMTDLLHVAHGMPHASTHEVFNHAGKMAVIFEKLTNGHSRPVAKPITKKTKHTRKRVHRETMVTRRTLRERGLEYPTVADCAHDLVITKGMSMKDAAKRMGFDIVRLRCSLSNFKLKEKRRLWKKQRQENAERKA